jgi:hypothetical protein
VVNRPSNRVSANPLNRSLSGIRIDHVLRAVQIHDGHVDRLVAAPVLAISRHGFGAKIGMPDRVVRARSEYTLQPAQAVKPCGRPALGPANAEEPIVGRTLDFGRDERRRPRPTR